MTVPPSTAERFAIVPLSTGPAPADAIITGSMSAVMEYIPQSVARQDAIEELEKARFTADQISSLQEKTRAVQATMLSDSINHLTARLDVLVARRDEEAREREAEEETAEAKKIADELAALPDPDDPRPHENTGNLHTLSAKEDPGDPTDDTEGYLPEELAPPPDPPPEQKGTVFPQPTAIQANEE
jgi:hypothetical protein